jgi:hypothetical protein
VEKVAALDNNWRIFDNDWRTLIAKLGAVE